MTCISVKIFLNPIKNVHGQFSLFLWTIWMMFVGWKGVNLQR